MLEKIQNRSLSEAVEIMWQQGFLNRVALERLYINNEVQHRVRTGEKKVDAIEQLSREMNCSYEKIRAVVYNKQI